MDYQPDNLEIEAGITTFEKYKDLNTLETLSGGNILEWDNIKALPYEDVFIKLMMNKDKAEFNRRYHEIVKSKNQ